MFENLRKWKRLKMKWIDIVGVRFHQLHSQAYKTDNSSPLSY